MGGKRLDRRATRARTLLVNRRRRPVAFPSQLPVGLVYGLEKGIERWRLVNLPKAREAGSQRIQVSLRKQANRDDLRHGGPTKR